MKAFEENQKLKEALIDCDIVFIMKYLETHDINEETEEMGCIIYEEFTYSPPNYVYWAWKFDYPPFNGWKRDKMIWWPYIHASNHEDAYMRGIGSGISLNFIEIPSDFPGEWHYDTAPFKKYLRGLIGFGPETNITWTLLQWTSICNLDRSTRLLLLLGADPLIQDKMKRNALDVAKLMDDYNGGYTDTIDIIENLMSKGSFSFSNFQKGPLKDPNAFFRFL